MPAGVGCYLPAARCRGAEPWVGLTGRGTGDELLAADRAELDVWQAESWRWQPSICRYKPVERRHCAANGLICEIHAYCGF